MHKAIDVVIAKLEEKGDWKKSGKLQNAGCRMEPPALLGRAISHRVS